MAFARFPAHCDGNHWIGASVTALLEQIRERRGGPATANDVLNDILIGGCGDAVVAGMLLQFQDHNGGEAVLQRGIDPVAVLHV